MKKHGAFWMHLYPLLLFAIIVLSLLFLVDAKSFSVEQVRPGLLVVSTEYGSADIALRSGRGAGPDA